MNEEYGIVFDIDHFAVHDGPGIRTVIYLKGCPLRCIWCHSPESHIKAPQLLNIEGRAVASGKNMSVSEVYNEVIDDKVFFDSSGGGVTLSGGEILYQPQFAKLLLERLKNSTINTIVETSGMGQWQNLENIAEYTDMFYYDIKCMNSERHIKYTGADNGIILANLRKLAVSSDITLRVPLIPGLNDSIDDIKEIYSLAVELNIKNIHLLRYNTSAPAKYQWLDIPYQLGDLQRQSDGYIDKLIEIAPNEIVITVF